jgi:hypothetical protein
LYYREEHESGCSAAEKSMKVDAVLYAKLLVQFGLIVYNA